MLSAVDLPPECWQENRGGGHVRFRQRVVDLIAASVCDEQSVRPSIPPNVPGVDLHWLL